MLERVKASHAKDWPGVILVTLTCTSCHDLVGVRHQQDVDTVRLMKEVALCNVEGRVRSTRFSSATAPAAQRSAIAALPI